MLEFNYYNTISIFLGRRWITSGWMLPKGEHKIWNARFTRETGRRWQFRQVKSTTKAETEGVPKKAQLCRACRGRGRCITANSGPTYRPGSYKDRRRHISFRGNLTLTLFLRMTPVCVSEFLQDVVNVRVQMIRCWLCLFSYIFPTWNLRGCSDVPIYECDSSLLTFSVTSDVVVWIRLGVCERTKGCFFYWTYGCEIVVKFLRNIMY